MQNGSGGAWRKTPLPSPATAAAAAGGLSSPPVKTRWSMRLTRLGLTLQFSSPCQCWFSNLRTSKKVWSVQFASLRLSKVKSWGFCPNAIMGFMWIALTCGSIHTPLVLFVGTLLLLNPLNVKRVMSQGIVIHHHHHMKRTQVVWVVWNLQIFPQMCWFGGTRHKLVPLGFHWKKKKKKKKKVRYGLSPESQRDRSLWGEEELKNRFCCPCFALYEKQTKEERDSFIQIRGFIN